MNLKTHGYLTLAIEIVGVMVVIITAQCLIALHKAGTEDSMNQALFMFSLGWLVAPLAMIVAPIIQHKVKTRMSEAESLGKAGDVRKVYEKIRRPMWIKILWIVPIMLAYIVPWCLFGGTEKLLGMSEWRFFMFFSLWAVFIWLVMFGTIKMQSVLNRRKIEKLKIEGEI